MLPILVELQRLKRLDRTGWVLRGLANGTESVASHSFGVAITSMLLADEIRWRGGVIDAERVLRMALIHDWAETRVGDMPRTGSVYFGTDARKQAEAAAFADIVSTAANSAEYRSLHDEYEDRKTLESQLVKAADVIDLLLQTLALERAGAKGLDEFWDVTKDANFGLPGVAGEIVSEVLQSLLDARQRI